jgi:hypothetical protein
MDDAVRDAFAGGQTAVTEHVAHRHVAGKHELQNAVLSGDAEAMADKCGAAARWLRRRRSRPLLFASRRIDASNLRRKRSL